MSAYEFQIIPALILDWLIGDPENRAHPVRLMGNMALVFESWTRRAISSPTMAGIATVVLLLGTVLIITSLVTKLAYGLSGIIGFIVSVIIIYTGIATRDLYDHAMRVCEALEQDDLLEARRRVGMICGRDTANMDRESVIKAAVESVAENLVDGVTAPLFYAFIGGPVAVMLYKGVSTLDSMFGYRNERYVFFGWASARLDDLAAYIPARLTAITVPLASIVTGLNYSNSLKIFLRDRSRHPSPNAGQTESAFAGALGIRLGGPSTYNGVVHKKEYLGDSLEALSPEHIRYSLRLMIFASLIFCGLMLFLKHIVF